MKKESKTRFLIGAGLLAAFVLWTVLVRVIDVQAIGPRDSRVGFATLNRFFHELTGVHMSLYTVTDWLGLVPIAFALGFAIFGLCRLVAERSIRRVERSILVLGGFYVAVMAAYVFFETVVINYRPVLIGGYLEASYPSSTTLLVLCVMPTAIMQIGKRVGARPLGRLAVWAMLAFTVFMVVGRLISGVHWVSDIVGGAVLSAGLVTLYDAVCRMK